MLESTTYNTSFIGGRESPGSLHLKERFNRLPCSLLCFSFHHFRSPKRKKGWFVYGNQQGSREEYGVYERQVAGEKVLAAAEFRPRLNYGTN